MTNERKIERARIRIVETIGSTTSFFTRAWKLIENRYGLYCEICYGMIYSILKPRSWPLARLQSQTRFAFCWLLWGLSFLWAYSGSEWPKIITNIPSIYSLAILILQQVFNQSRNRGLNLFNSFLLFCYSIRLHRCHWIIRLRNLNLNASE